MKTLFTIFSILIFISFSVYSEEHTANESSFWKRAVDTFGPIFIRDAWRIQKNKSAWLKNASEKEKKDNLAHLKKKCEKMLPLEINLHYCNNYAIYLCQSGLLRKKKKINYEIVYDSIEVMRKTCNAGNRRSCINYAYLLSVFNSEKAAAKSLRITLDSGMIRGKKIRFYFADIADPFLLTFINNSSFKKTG